MGYELAYDQERDLMVGRVWGNIDETLVKEMAGDLAKLVASSGCHRLLNDLRNARIAHSALEIFGMPRIVDEEGVPVGCRRALVVPAPSEDFRFLETVSVNVYQRVRIFTDMQRAIAWLTGDAGSPDNQKAGEA